MLNFWWLSVHIAKTDLTYLVSPLYQFCLCKIINQLTTWSCYCGTEYHDYMPELSVADSSNALKCVLMLRWQYWRQGIGNYGLKGQIASGVLFIGNFHVSLAGSVSSDTTQGCLYMEQRQQAGTTSSQCQLASLLPHESILQVIVSRNCLLRRRMCGLLLGNTMVQLSLVLNLLAPEFGI